MFLLHNKRPFPFPFLSLTIQIPILNMSTSASPKKKQSAEEQRKEELQLSQVLKYHNQTKHNLTNFARGPQGLDWANQPNPFRRFVSSPTLPLLHPPFPPSPLYATLFNSLPPPQPITHSTISELFFNSLALSAWKTTGFSTWSLRVNPSSGNLHPTEAYIISPPIQNLSKSSFIGHYAPKEHCFEVRAEVPSGFLEKFLPRNGFLIGFSSIFWREAWKYGERAYRYCNHDVGHAIAAVAMAASGLGWDVKVLDGLGYHELERLMGLGVYPRFEIPDRPVKGRMPEIEFEHPDCVLMVFPAGMSGIEVDYPGMGLAIFELPELDWRGKPNSLSKEHVCWDIIYRTEDVVKKPLSTVTESICNGFKGSVLFSESSYKDLSVAEVVRKRRSAVDMDGETAIKKETFYQMLLHCMPSGSGCGEKQKRQLALPFRSLSWDCEVHTALFVHRVVGLPSGLYFLVRNEDHFDELKKATRSEFKWVEPDGCPDDLPLYELAQGDCTLVAKWLSCNQDIASDGCFSLGMVAHLEPTLRKHGVWMYPRLFWETGVLGQILYLEAHAVGISATGIGCFFDDPGIYSFL
ncbi:hypothetical protein LIER_14901 [Lithospermum erythrorhizon]|uniref:Nitroreductase domain-containing protein n=1 Tax=Lithospermum erythrorhizon TaxID=34254 RepID=A0AAV3Q0T8_LITER